jgi:hypothetical protein
LSLVVSGENDKKMLMLLCNQGSYVAALENQDYCLEHVGKGIFANSMAVAVM